MFHGLIFIYGICITDPAHLPFSLVRAQYTVLQRAQLVQLQTGRQRNRSSIPGKGKIFFLLHSFRQSPGPTQPPTQRVPRGAGAFSQPLTIIQCRGHEKQSLLFHPLYVVAWCVIIYVQVQIYSLMRCVVIFCMNHFFQKRDRVRSELHVKQRLCWTSVGQNGIPILG